MELYIYGKETVGQVAVSGVALVDNINRLVIQVMSAFAAGGIVVTSQYIGNKKYEMSESPCAQLEILMNVFSVITMVICYILVMWCDFGILGVWLGMFVDWDVRGISYSLRFLSKKWLTKKVI